MKLWQNTRIVFLLVLALTLPAWPAAALIAERCDIVQPTVPIPISALPAVAMCNDCDCYWSSECGTGKKCDYASGCTKKGKLDGTCKATTSTQLANADQVAQAVELWFDAYIATAISGKDGLPDARLVEQTTYLGLSDEARSVIRDEIFNSLDVLLGFDITHPRGNCLEQDLRCFAQIRIPIDEEGSALLQAGKDGLVRAIQNGDPRPVYDYLEAIWKVSDYHPHHTGRCYPHGHAGHEDPPADCQKDELGRIAELLISISGR